MSLQHLQKDFRPWAEALYGVARRYGLQPTVTSTFRSLSEQRFLYERWKRGESPYPAAAPGRSLHNYALAFDLQVNSDAGQDWLGAVWESWGGRWGGRFNDPIHFDTGATIPG